MITSRIVPAFAPLSLLLIARTGVSAISLVTRRPHGRQLLAARRTFAATVSTSMDPMDYMLVYSTAPTADVASALSSALVEARLAACVSTASGVSSTYVWEGKVTTETEFVLLIKTRKSLLAELTTFIKENHPYEVPEIIATPIAGGLPTYLKWIDESTKNPKEVD
jgi:periplasmic divalent cation tolerance protein